MLFEKKDTIVFIGDSISDYNRKRPIGEGHNEAAWGTSYVANAASFLCGRYPELGLRIINMGIGGNQLHHLEERWQTDVMDLKPDWVVVLIGINDVWRQFDCPDMPELHVSPEDFEAGYIRLLERTLPAVKGMILLTPYFMEPNRDDPMRHRMDQYGEIVQRVASQYQQPCVDLQAGWDRFFQHMHPCSIAWDRIHPNQVGCMYLAMQFLRAVGASL